jgi:hypothetical protein
MHGSDRIQCCSPELLVQRKTLGRSHTLQLFCPDAPDDPSRTYAMHRLRAPGRRQVRRTSVNGPQDRPGLGVLHHVFPEQVVMPGIHPALGSVRLQNGARQSLEIRSQISAVGRH